MLQVNVVLFCIAHYARLLYCLTFAVNAAMLYMLHHDTVVLGWVPWNMEAWKERIIKETAGLPVNVIDYIGNVHIPRIVVYYLACAILNHGLHCQLAIVARDFRCSAAQIHQTAVQVRKQRHEKRYCRFLAFVMCIALLGAQTVAVGYIPFVGQTLQYGLVVYMLLFVLHYYRVQADGSSIVESIRAIETHWLYFLGLAFPFIVLVYNIPSIISSGLFQFFIPGLVTLLCSISPHRSDEHIHIPFWIVPRVLARILSLAFCCLIEPKMD